MSYSSENISLVRANTISTAYDSGDVNENTMLAYANLFYPYVLDNGGNTNIVSLTIDVLNKDDLEENTEDLPNKNWVNKDRLRNGLSEQKAMWAFKEGFHGVKKSRALSNAFCFGGQKLTFYIAPKGHSVGSVNGEWLYCKTSLVVMATDIINGTNETLCSFDGFESSSDSASRYFTWSVPSISNEAFSEYGLFGIVVLKIMVTETYYMDAEFKKPSSKNIPNKNQSCLQLLIYSGAKEIIEVDSGDANILTSTPLYTETLEQIFDNTVFELLQSTNQNDLTNAQKRAIIADQIAAIFVSQHPVVTADFYPAKIIGMGASASVVPRKVLEDSITYSKRYPDIIPLVKDRLFGMFATYKYFDFVIDMGDVIANYSQSTQYLRDPVRTVYIDENDVLNPDVGVGGIIFNPYAMSISGSDSMLKVPDAIPIDVSLYEGLFDIDDITITKTDGSPLSYTDDVVKVSFSVVWGSDNIEEIRYTIIADSCKDYQSYVESNTSSRSHTFNLQCPVTIDPYQTGQYITAQVAIEDIKGNVSTFIYDEFVQGTSILPSLYGLKFYQRGDGSDIVDIYYTYDNTSEVNNSYLYVQFSVDSGVVWSNVSSSSLTGDFGNGVMPGRRRVMWQPSIDLEDVEIEGDILCRLTLYDTDEKEAVGNVLTGSLVWDVEKPEVAIVRSSVKDTSEVSAYVLYPDFTYTIVDSSIAIEFVGEAGTEAIVVLGGESITVGNINGSFVWDIGGDDQHLFTYEKEKIEVVVNNVLYEVIYNGTGSFLFTVNFVDELSSSSYSSSSSSYSSSSSSSNSSVSSSSDSSSSVSSESSSSQSSDSSISSDSSSSVSSSSESSSSVSSESSSFSSYIENWSSSSESSSSSSYIENWSSSSESSESSSSSSYIENWSSSSESSESSSSSSSP